MGNAFVFGGSNSTTRCGDPRVGSMFTGEGQQWIFPEVVKRIFPGAPKVVGFNFTHSKLK